MKLGINLYREQKVISYNESLFDKIEDYLLRERDSGGDGSAYDRLERSLHDLVSAVDEIAGSEEEFEFSVDVKSVRPVQASTQ